MTNFIFKSSTDLQKIGQQLKILLAEQKHQRSDLAILLALINKLINASNLQKQVDDYFEDTKQEEEVDNDSGNN